MKIIVPSVEIMHSCLASEVVTPEQFIERVGRTCYKSEDKITDDSAAKFVSALIRRGHEAMIEHWNLIFKTDAFWYEEIVCDWELLQHNANVPLNAEDRLRSHIRFTDWDNDGEMRCVISGNMRAWRDYVKAYVNGFGFVPWYLHGMIRCYPLFFPEYQKYVPEIVRNDILIPIYAEDLVGDVENGVHRNVTVKFTCDRGVSHELVRHRVFSFAQESTRYCNYSGDKFGNEITVVRPSWLYKFNQEVGEGFDGIDSYIGRTWEMSCRRAEADYFTMLDHGAIPQEARSVLPGSLKTEVIMTSNLHDWNHFFGLRCAPDAHPDMQEVAIMARELFASEKVF